VTNRTPPPTRPDPGWARTIGLEERPYRLIRLMNVTRTNLETLGMTLGVSPRVITKLDRVGLTSAQAVTAAGLCGIDALDVWQDLDEPLSRFLERHEKGRCALCRNAAGVACGASS
jgi:hypothetical protein